MNSTALLAMLMDPMLFCRNQEEEEESNINSNAQQKDDQLFV